jgi:hypothetical protein
MKDHDLHRATIRWSPAQERVGLPHSLRTIDPAWFADQKPRTSDGWSLVCEFEQAPRVQSNPSTAFARFLVEAAPHSWLLSGAALRLFEYGTGEIADVAILD